MAGLFSFIFHNKNGMSSFPLTKSIIFQDGHIAPPTSFFSAWPEYQWSHGKGYPDGSGPHMASRTTVPLLLPARSYTYTFVYPIFFDSSSISDQTFNFFLTFDVWGHWKTGRRAVSGRMEFHLRVLPYTYGVSIVIPFNLTLDGWFQEKSIYKWMNRGTPIYGNPHIPTLSWQFHGDTHYINPFNIHNCTPKSMHSALQTILRFVLFLIAMWNHTFFYR